MRSTKNQFGCSIFLVMAFALLGGSVQAAPPESPATSDGLSIRTVTIETDIPDDSCEQDAGEAPCEDACEDAPCEETTEEQAAVDVPQTPRTTHPLATHKQSAVISVNGDGLSQAELTTFCLTPSGDLLAACQTGDHGEVRIYSPVGEYRHSWSLPVVPEAINVGSDGLVYLGGAGKLLQLDLEGSVLQEVESPHAADLLKRKDEIRESVIKQQKQMASMYSDMSEQYQERLTDAEEKLEAYQSELAELTAASEEDEAEEQTQRKITRLERKIKNQQRMQKASQQMIDQMDQMIEQMGAKELTEEELEEKVLATMAYKMKVASISEADGHVFVATSAPAGYGYAVWKMDHEFANAETIVKDLSGCCGQMDVQAGPDGLFVAENSQHRVCRFDTNGKRICEWGSQARSGVKGFGSCCNPMNVAFGPGGEVYTAESGTGRIKRYDTSGKLVGLVGSVEIVPGCKKVSIAVGPDGERVYMLDITRHHIVMMERVRPDSSIEDGASSDESADVNGITDVMVERQASTSGIGSLFRAIGAAIGQQQ